MKKFIGILTVIVMVGMLASCGKKKQEVIPETPKQEAYVPVAKSMTIDLKTAKKYDYRNAPMPTKATKVVVTYGKEPYTQPTVIKYTYANGDSYTYTVPATFGLWENENGKIRVLQNQDCTVWIQGQTKGGTFHEFVFYGDPKYNGTKVKPNSYKNLPAGEIKYQKK